jgi:exoribonuclease R
VAQKLITDAGRIALLRHHEEPLEDGLDKVVTLAKSAMNFTIDTSSSKALHNSLVHLSQRCDDVTLQCLTTLLMTPMRPANYVVAGQVGKERWGHYALNIPYYTHFTSPIRRYPDVLVHRLLQATLEGGPAVKQFQFDETALGMVCGHCNEMKKASKDAQERCDRVYLSLFVLRHPLVSTLGIVLSVGVTTFNVYIPAIGSSAMLYLQDHTDMLTYASHEEKDGTRRILLQQKLVAKVNGWDSLEICVNAKIKVTVTCREKPPVDIRLRLEGAWKV